MPEGRSQEIEELLQRAVERGNNVLAHAHAEIGSYRVERKLVQGGMGVVYRAIDTRLNRPVEIKFLASEVPDIDDAAGSRARRRRPRLSTIPTS